MRNDKRKQITKAKAMIIKAEQKGIAASDPAEAIVPNNLIEHENEQAQGEME